jgi:hypothetical protein
MRCPAAETIQGNIFYSSVSSDLEIRAKVPFWETLPAIPTSDFFIIELQGMPIKSKSRPWTGMGVKIRLFRGQFHRWQYW